ncbi:hypothetical protein DCS_03711 [Drechmeria coniospora]|uniref:Vacuolar ATP synthase subunit D n=1 Tax=Drechmeria coniospora TaxID=98403 RepID=A0A151GI02_DRECN|nr:hypothetical protein DCS_03711 [Drechmeria coniospora]KYK56708.1 hypothetical protein DCS_03711 [Drechmeria coniospora]
MSGAAERESVFPTRQSLGIMKAKLKGAETGHSLLKRKSEALTKRFREITKRIDEAKRKMGRVMQIAAFSLAEVTYAVGTDIGYQVQESAKSARFRIRTRQENVSGVLLPAFESHLAEGSNDFGLTGLGKGGQQVQRCRETYARAVEALVELASLQTAFVILDEVIKVANKKHRDTAAADAEMKAKRKVSSLEQRNEAHEGHVENSRDILAADEDEDIIF